MFAWNAEHGVDNAQRQQRGERRDEVALTRARHLLEDLGGGLFDQATQLGEYAGVKPRETILRSRMCSGSSMSMMEPRYSRISAVWSKICVPCPELKSPGRRLMSTTSRWAPIAQNPRGRGESGRLVRTNTGPPASRRRR